MVMDLISPIVGIIRILTKFSGDLIRKNTFFLTSPKKVDIKTH